MLIFTLLHTSAVNNDNRRGDFEEELEAADLCSKFTIRKEIRELSNEEIKELLEAIGGVKDAPNCTTVAESMDTVLYLANVSFPFPYWDFRLDSLNPFESAFLESMRQSPLSTSNNFWLSKYLYEAEKKDPDSFSDSELLELKNQAQQWVHVLQLGNIWTAMMNVMVEEFIADNVTESYDTKSAWLYKDPSSVQCYGKTKIGGKCSSSEMCYQGGCLKGYCRSYSEFPEPNNQNKTEFNKTKNLPSVPDTKVNKNQSKTTQPPSTTTPTTLITVPKEDPLKDLAIVQEAKMTPEDPTAQSKTRNRPKSTLLPSTTVTLEGHPKFRYRNRKILSWSDSPDFPAAYFSITVIEGKLRNKKRTQRRANGFRVETTGNNVPQGYNHVLEGLQASDTNAIVRVLSPAHILPFVEFRLNVFNKRDEKCHQRCLSSTRKGHYRRCKRDIIRLTMYESYSDPVQWYTNEKDALATQWIGRGYYRRRKLDYLLFRCNA
ncbi:hypothetical protein L596_025018 [Steinernema carpocapsae]|uniref:Uncharacterized protein n=1 Tax=Steinernema carpocapsae TaxID=34508 RepID=A0A4U5M6K2_STECR|nr:hypothetical protein L596_025018 [Steinernema carpocapsae]